MDLKNLIYTRKSCRKYNDEILTVEELQNIENFIFKAEKLNDIEFTYDILTLDEVKLRTRWKAPYYLSIYSKSQMNVGFVFQQVSLYMQSMGIGNCWVGMGEPKIKKDDFVILIAFGKSIDINRSINDFKRKNIKDFCDFESEKLKPAYYAPSAINSQPWYFKHTDVGFDVYQLEFNIVKRKLIGKYNNIDMGIALSHLYISNPDSFTFEVKSDVDDLKGYSYVGSVKI